MANNENLTKGKKFTSDNQPSGDQKSNGHKRKYLLKDIASQIITGESKEVFSKVAEYLGVEIDKIDIEIAMHLKQMEKALKDGDTRAYIAIMDRIKGKPIQDISLQQNTTPKITGITFEDPPEAKLN